MEQLEEKRERKQTGWHNLIWPAMFIVSLAVFSQIGYSDWDDSFLLENIRQRGLSEYLQWRYETWSSRFFAECLFYLFFRCNIWVWRVVNAALLTLLPFLMLKLAALCGAKRERQKNPDIWLMILAIFFYLVIRLRVFAYSCVWMTGSIVYLPGTVCGMIALIYAANCVYKEDFSHKALLYALPASLCTVLSTEQMGAVVIAVEGIAWGYLLLFQKKFRLDLLAAAVCSEIVFLLALKSPGNTIRTELSVQIYLPLLETITVPEHLFITLHWLLSTFANENAMLIAMVYLCCLWKRGLRGIADIMALVFGLAAVLSSLGADIFCDMGILLSEMSGRTEILYTWGVLEPMQRFAMIWWGVTLLYALFYVWYAKRYVVMPLCLMAGIATEAVMYFSPTMYASGERLLFAANVVIYLIILWIAKEMMEKRRKAFIMTLCAFGCLNFASQLSVLREMIGKMG